MRIASDALFNHDVVWVLYSWPYHFQSFPLTTDQDADSKTDPPQFHREFRVAGGIRTNAFVSGGFVPVERRGKNFEGIINVADWYGTLTELVGVDMKASEWQIGLKGMDEMFFGKA